MPNRKRGRPAKEGNYQLFSLRLPEELHLALRLYAVRRGRYLNDILGEVIAAWWARQEDEGDPRKNAESVRSPGRSVPKTVPSRGEKQKRS